MDYFDILISYFYLCVYKTQRYYKFTTSEQSIPTSSNDHILHRFHFTFDFHSLRFVVFLDWNVDYITKDIADARTKK